MPYPLDSEGYKVKMEVVEYLKQKGLDYWKEPIPGQYYKNYEKAYLEKY
jgi:ribose 5-phosphate isomerase RpiB